jgi:hypothetical protein
LLPNAVKVIATFYNLYAEMGVIVASYISFAVGNSRDKSTKAVTL